MVRSLSYMEISTFQAHQKKISEIFLKKTVIFLIASIASFVIGYYFWQIIYEKNFSAYPFFLAAILISAIIFNITSLAVGSYRFLILYSIIGTVLLYFPLFLNWGSVLKNIWIFIACFFISAALWLWGSRKIKNEAANIIKIKWWKIGSCGLKFFFWSLTFVIAALLYFSPQFKLGLLINENSFNKILQSATPAVKYFIPNFNWNMTVDEFIQKQAEQQLSGQKPKTETYLKQLSDLGVVPEYAFVGENINKMLATINNQSIAEQYKEGLSSKLGIKISGQEKLNEFTYTMALSQYRKASLKTQNYILVAIIAIIALTAKSVSIVLGWIALITGFLIYELLIANGFLKITSANTLKEKVEL